MLYLKIEATIYQDIVTLKTFCFISLREVLLFGSVLLLSLMKVNITYLWKIFGASVKQ